MKKIVLVIVLLLSIPFIQGCGSETTTGMAVGGGLSELLRETFKGAEADIARKKALAIAAYNEGITQGKTVAELDELSEKVDHMVLVEKGFETSRKFLGVDFSKPETTSLAVTGAIELAMLIWGGRKLLKTQRKYSAEKKGLAKALTSNGGTVNAETVYKSIAAERRVLKLPSG